MTPQLAAAWQTIRTALAAVSCNLAEHQQIQTAAALVENKLTPRSKAAAPAAAKRR